VSRLREGELGAMVNQRRVVMELAEYMVFAGCLLVVAVVVICVVIGKMGTHRR
jgi:hypothetical protein